MASRKIWLLRLVPTFPFGRLLTGILLLSLLLPLFYLGAMEEPADSTPALFFSLIIAYIIPVFSLITATSGEALEELRPILDLDELAFEEARARLDSASLRQTGLCLGIGALSGFAHLSLIRGSVTGALEMSSSLAGFLSALGAVLVWMIMTTVITMLVKQTVLFGHLGANHVRISLLSTRDLLPFARVSIISSLAIIGALALFPLIAIESGQNLLESVPGAIAILVPLMIMFIIPVWPIHRRLATLKEQDMKAVNNRIGACLDGHDTPLDLEAPELRQLTLLLNYRREITRVSTWPFDMGNITRLVLYLIIVPLTWAGAALIEILVDSLL